MTTFVYWLIASFCFHLALGWSGCPAPEDVLPCVCKRSKRGYTNVTCEGTTEEVNSGLKQLSDRFMGVDEFTIKSDDIASISFRYFGLTDIHYANFITPNLEYIDADAFKTVERNFKILRIHVSKLTDISQVLSPLAFILRLEKLFVQRSLITKIPAEAFTNVFDSSHKFLYEIDFSYNRITEVQKNAFDTLVNLRRLFLTHNMLTAFHPTALNKVNKLNMLDLSFNNITDLPVELINKINRNQKINLVHNKIVKIELEDIRKAAERYVHLNLTDNQIDCDNSFKVLAFMNVEKKKHLVIGKCATPIHLKGLDFKNLTVESFN